MRKRILFISHLASKTGAPIALLHTISVLKEKLNIECDIMLMQDGPLRESFAQYGKVFIGSNSKSVLHKVGRKLNLESAKYHYLSIGKSGNYDLIYANSSYSLPIANHIKHKYGIPLILHVHESAYLLSQRGLKAEDFSNCNCIITVSEFSADVLVRNYGCDKNKLIISHPFSDLTISLLNEIINACPSKHPLKIGFSGTGNWVKAIDRVPLLLKMFYDKYPKENFQFYWIGGIDTDEDEKFYFELSKFDLNDDILVTGAVPDPERYYRDIDVFVLLSREDSFPLVALENAALAKPIVCFDGCSGACEWVSQGAGEIIPFMDLVRLGEVLYEYWGNPEKRISDGLNARECVKSMYVNEKDMPQIVMAVKKNLEI